MITVYSKEELLKLKPNATKTFKNYLAQIIDEFHFAFLTDKYEDICSNKNKKYIFYPVDKEYTSSDKVFKEAIDLLRQKGWNVDYDFASNARGTFHAIVINL